MCVLHSLIVCLVMLTEESLQAFIDISKHVSFSKKLAHVIIATNVYGHVPTHFKSTDAAACWIQGHDAQRALMNTGVDATMLSDAFRGLENLQTVGIRDCEYPT